MAYTTIDDPSAYFHTQLYTGNGASSHSITNDANAGDFKPDWLWIKQRSQGSRSHSQWDTSRGNSQRLQSDNSFGEETQTNDQKTFDTDGFTVGAGSITNENSQTFVAWQWKANGGTTSSNTDGSITSTVQANTTAGFSIVSYQGNTTADTVGHGLGQAPDWIIVKNRDTGNEWVHYHKSLGADSYIYFTTAAAASGDSSVWNNTAPSSSVFSIGTSNATSGETSSNNLIAYCFAEKQGYSKIGSYTGNGNADGPFVYTGFKPAWIMIKRTDAANSWYLVDSTRGSTNVISAELEANNNGAEATSNVRLDSLSNGYKIRTSGAAYNASGGTYIYMAFAEHPFVGSDGVPTTAR